MIIIYSSHHHGNTEKLVKKVVDGTDIKVISVEDAFNIDFNEYNCIGFASGIDFGKFYPDIIEIAKKIPENKNVFAIFTCASVNSKMGGQIREIAELRNCKFLGKYGCKGYNTYGPWKLIGGMNKNHPNEDEINEGKKFIENIIKELE